MAAAGPNRYGGPVPTPPPSHAPDLPRLVPLEGCLNFRDLGGLPTRDGGRVRRGRVYRSDALHLLTPADVRRLRDELGLAAVVDLRSAAELATDGRGPLAGEPIAFHHVPLFDAEHMTAEARSVTITLADRYALLADFAAVRIGRVLVAVAEAGGPAVYHCAAGKDRTGVISAIILGVLDVPDEAIVADYVASRENLDAIIARLMETEGYQKMLAALPPETLHAEPATMEAFLARVRERHGSFRDYARSTGVDDATLARLQTELVERS